MTEDQQLHAARAAFARRDWAAAREAFRAAGGVDEAGGPVPGALGTDDLAMLASACWWLALPDENAETNAEVHRRLLQDGATALAALVAMEIGFCQALRGDEETAAGWMARARRLFDEVPEAPERGHLLALDADLALAEGDLTTAEALAARVLELGDRHRDATLQAQGLFLCGVVAIRHGRVREGRARLDEAMLPVRSGEVIPEWAGNLYCRMMQLCHELADVRRARRWTAVTEEWCRGQGPASVFAHVCRVHRVQLMQVSGEWDRAVVEAERAAAELADLDVVPAAEAHYLVGEVRRLQGDLEASAAAYRLAHEQGRDPLPGLALLQLQRGRTAAAASSLDAALRAETVPLQRAPLLAGRAEVALAAADVRHAARCVDELDVLAEQHESPGWRAEVLRWRGAVLLARGLPADAVRVLRQALAGWHDLGAPYRACRVRLDLADAYEALADHGSATRERDGATVMLERLGAVGDLDRLRRRHGAAGHAPGELSPREVEVVAAIAAGETNREAAADLHISERTVARHLANVYLKAGVSTRTAAVSWAREHGLV